MLATAGNHLATAEILLVNGASTSLKNSYDETALLIAVKSGFVEMAELLIRKGADPNLSDKKLVTPLHYASVYGDFYMADLLLYYNADINSQTSDGTTPLMAAVWAGTAEITDLLLINGANVNLSDANGISALHIAAQNGDTLILKLLLDKGADLNMKDQNNYNALAVAVRENHTSAAKWLLEKGIETNGQALVNPVAVATKYRSLESLALLHEMKAGGSKPIGFDQIFVFTGMKVTNHDFMSGFSVSVKEPFLNGGIKVGLWFKPFSTRLLVQQSENAFTQYHDKRSMVYAGLFKDFSIRSSSVRANLYFTTSLDLNYTFGNAFPGTGLLPPHFFQAVPAVGFRYEKQWYHISADLIYQPTRFNGSGPVWMEIGAGINLFLDDVRSPGKTLSWY